MRATGQPDAVVRLEPLLAQFAGRDKPTTALAWLQHSPAAPTLRGLLRGEILLSHEALDTHDVGQATAYLRSWLVGHGILPARDERIARFERWAARMSGAIDEHADTTHLTAYARWKLRPELARRLASPRARPSSHKATYYKLRTAIRLTAWLHDHDRTLTQLNQPLLDDWLAAASGRALATRDFLDWAHHTGLLLKLHVQRPAAQAPSTPIDDTTRLRQARRLLDDEQLELAARIAGCLVLLYGQRVTRSVTLRTDAVIDNGDTLLLRLGDEPIEVAAPIAELLRRLHNPTNGPWLLPGAKPGTHIGPERIRRRLRQLGIHAERARPAALLALAATVPAPILSRLLGYCDDTANHWRRAAAGDWARYASLAATPNRLTARVVQRASPRCGRSYEPQVTCPGAWWGRCRRRASAMRLLTASGRWSRSCLSKPPGLSAWGPGYTSAGEVLDAAREDGVGELEVAPIDALDEP
jgi:hypothetical protein